MSCEMSAHQEKADKSGPSEKQRAQLLSSTAFAYATFEVSFMPRGDKSKYTDKQKRKAEHIEEGYERRGVPAEEAERRAWATVNATDRGGKQAGGSGRGKAPNKVPTRKGGRRGGAAAAARPKAARQASARKAAATRKARSGK
jgi:plasmid stabilization system protein ParE